MFDFVSQFKHLQRAFEEKYFSDLKKSGSYLKGLFSTSAPFPSHLGSNILQNTSPFENDSTLE